MKTLSKLLVAPFLVFAFLIFSCNSDNGDDDIQVNCGPAYCVADLQGTWNAETITFTFCGSGMMDPSSVEIISEGAEGTMVIQSSGRFTLTLTFPEGPPEIISGRIYFEDGEFFAIQFDDDEPGDPTYFGDTLSGNTFSLNGGPETAEFDFDEDGNDDCASVDLTFVKA